MTDQTASMAVQKGIDIAEFVRLGGALSGEVAVRDLPRLRDFVIMGDERLQYELRGALSPRLEAQITCIIRGLVALECQRCLAAFEHPVATNSTLVFVDDESKLPPMEEENESIDYVVAGAVLDVPGLLEDEIILALPIAPRHEAGDCKASAQGQSGDDKSSPFAALARLKRN